MKLDDLKADRRWVAYTTDKRPINPHTGKLASTTDATTWATYEQAQKRVEADKLAGVGIVFTGDGIVGIDLDDCIEPINDTDFTPHPYTKYLLNLADSYTEVTPSGTGLHIIGTATIPRSVKAKLNGIGVEIYDRARYFTVTHWHVESQSEHIADVQHIVDTIMDDIAESEKPSPDVAPLRTTAPATMTTPWIKAVMERRIAAAERMVSDAPDGMRHNARLKAGRLLGGYMAGAERAGYYSLTDDEALGLIADARPPSDNARRKERKAIADGIAYGRTAPIDIPTPPEPIAPSPRADVADTTPTPRQHDDYHLTDLGNGKRLVDACGERLRYVAEWKQWIVWDGARWSLGDDAGVVKMAHAVALSIYDGISAQPSEAVRKAMTKWATASESAVRIDAMIKSARPYLTVAAKLLDTHPDKIVVKNGTINLRTGALTPHDPSDYITKMTAINYNPYAVAPKWVTFLAEIMPSADLIAYVQRMTGYILTGSTDAHCLFFLYGTGKNGKSTFLEALRLLTGDYYIVTSIEALLANDQTAGATPYVAALAGMRCAMASEMPEGRRFNESIIKDITGGGTITARMLYGAPFQYQPSHKLVISGNYKPRIPSTDNGIWRRMNIIPFTETIATPRPMQDIIAEFHSELEGILAWAVQGAVAWYAHGLPYSEDINQATSSYRDEEDVVARFITERCVVVPGTNTLKHRVYEEWQRWTESENEKAAHAWSQRRFTEQLLRKGFAIGGQGRMFYEGIGLVSRVINDDGA
jgi:putative DNA primase/helicase